MRSTFHAVWSLVGCLGAMANAAGVLDIGLVFPRANQTYEPSGEFPIVWVFQNANLAKHLQPRLEFRLLNMSHKFSDWIAYDQFQRHLSNFSGSESEPYFYWTHVKLDGEGPVRLGWQGHWVQCEKKSPGTPAASTEFAVNRSSNFLVDFEVKRGGQKADLIAATANGQECPDRGFAISVTGETDEVLRERERVTCAVVDSSPSPTPTANPCRVKIDKAVVESMEAVTFKTKCSQPLGKPANCPKEDHAFRQVATAGTAALAAAAIGALRFLLA